MGTTSWSGSGSEGYTSVGGVGGLNPWIGWGISTLLLFFLNRNSDSGSSTSSQQPSKFTEDNVNCIGQPVPVVLGRCMVKNPLISYYGDFNAEPYTEEYGAWSGLSIWPALSDILLSIIGAIEMPDNVITNTGKGYTVDAGAKRAAIVNAVANFILWLLLQLFNEHEARTTIQKGFLYYLGWQHIICWTGKNTGLRKLYMNVYEAGMEPVETESPDINPYDYVHPDESVFVSTALFSRYDSAVSTKIDAAWGGFTQYVGYYDLNGYATGDDINSINVLDDFYADSTSDLLQDLDDLSGASGCIIVLQGNTVSALGQQFFEQLYSTKGIVVWQLDTLPLNTVDLSYISDEDFRKYFDPSLDSQSDVDIINWLNKSDKETTFHLDARQLLLNSIEQVRDTEFSGLSLGQVYKKLLMPYTAPKYQVVTPSDYFIDTELHCPLDFYYAIGHLVEMTHFPSTIVRKGVTLFGDLWEQEHMTGIDVDIDNKDMFGGYDEGGGFVGRISYYFGNRLQPKDPWMIKSMTVSTIEEELRGLTPQYPMYFTCVVSNKEKTGGAYIGKQATIPEMWFEVLNYPSRLGDYWKKELLKDLIDELQEEYKKSVEYLKGQSPAVQEYMEAKMKDLDEALHSYQDAAQVYLNMPTWDDYMNKVDSWSGGTSYDVGDIVKYNDIRYACTEEHTASAFDDDLASGKWKELSQQELLPWEPNTDYVLGDVVEYLGQIYTCTFDSQPSNTKLQRIDNRKSFYDEDWTLYDEDTYPAPYLLNDIYAFANAAYEYFPPTNREEFGRTLRGLMDLAKSGGCHLGKLGDDLNPAEAIYEILVNDYWGCNYTENRIDVLSLVKLGAVCEQENLGISCLINRTAQANEYITKILNHINAVKYDDPKTGKLTFKLIRNNYDVNSIKTFDVSNTESCEFSRLDWSETTSAVEVSFTDASNKYDTGQFTFTDVSNRLITGFYTSKSVDGDYFTTTANAKWLAQMNQLANGYPLSAVNLVTNRYAYDVTIGDPIKVSWEPYGLTQVVYRVTDIDYATLTDGKISITAIEDVFGFDKLDFDVSESPQWTDPTENPTNIIRYKYVEEPYETVRALDTYIYAYAAKPTSDVVYWNVWRNVGGNYVKTSQSIKWSTVGRLTYGYIKEFEIDENGFEFSSIGSGGTDLIENKIRDIDLFPSTYTNTSGLNLVIVDDEWMSYDSIEKLPNGHYQLKGIIRGIFDTLPEQHTAESIIYFVEDKQNVAGAINTVAVSGSTTTEYLELRTETLNAEQEFDVALVNTVTTTRRTEQPSIMANMQFGTDMGSETVYQYDYTADTIFSGDLLFKFIGRNKFNNYGIISQVDTDTNVTVASDTKNVIKTRSNSIDGEWKTDAYDSVLNKNIENSSLKWEQFCQRMGSSLQDANSVLLDVMTYDETRQLYSYAKYEKTINWKVPRFIGVVANAAEAQTLADSYINISTNIIEVPATDVSPALYLITTECPILIEGTLLTDSSLPYAIKCQDGNYYRLTNNAYRIVGWDEEENAILASYTIGSNYVLRSDFTQLVNNYPVYYKYNGEDWESFTISDS